MGGCPHQNLQQDGEHSIEEGKRILSKPSSSQQEPDTKKGLEHSTRAVPAPPHCQWKPWVRAAETAKEPHSMCLFYSLHRKSNKINGSVSRGLVAVTQREMLINPVVLAEMLFLGHLSLGSPCKEAHHTCKQAVPRALPLPSGQLTAKDMQVLQQCCP